MRIPAAVLLTTALAASAAPARAAADPDLLILEAKVGALSNDLVLLRSTLEILDGQAELREPRFDAALGLLVRARERDIEAMLAECAATPEKCVPPIYLTTTLAEDCQAFEGQGGSHGHQHDVKYECPLREVIVIVLENVSAARAQGLVRDYESADRDVEAAIAAAQAGDGWTAFSHACAAYRTLSCPR